jgi:hypothetical protein
VSGREPEAPRSLVQVTIDGVGYVVPGAVAMLLAERIADHVPHAPLVGLPGPLKAGDIREPGFYWHLSEGGYPVRKWSVVELEVFGGDIAPTIYVIGNDQGFDPGELDGDFFGPMPAPPAIPVPESESVRVEWRIDDPGGLMFPRPPMIPPPTEGEGA